MRFLFAVLRWVAAFAVLALIYVVGGFAWSYYIGDRAPKSAPMVEMIDKNEDFYTARIIESAIALSMSSRDQLIQSSKDSTIGLDANGHLVTSAKTAPGFQTPTYRRDVHAKSHGCVNATFQVASDLPDRFAWGIFAHPNKKLPSHHPLLQRQATAKFRWRPRRPRLRHEAAGRDRNEAP